MDSANQPLQETNTSNGASQEVEGQIATESTAVDMEGLEPERQGSEENNNGSPEFDGVQSGSDQNAESRSRPKSGRPKSGRPKSGRPKSSRKPKASPAAGEFSSLDPKDYDIVVSDEEFSYTPPDKDGALPDIYRLMDTLEGGESDLETTIEPPSLFARPEHVPTYKKISELKLQLQEEELDDYIDHFDKTVEDDVLMIGSISLEEVQEEEKRLRDEHIMYQRQEAEQARERQERILLQEEEAKRRVARSLKERRRLLAKKEEIAQQRERLLMDRLHKAFRRAENQLTDTLYRRKAEVKTMYGDLTMADGEYGGSKGRRWKVDWDRTPQPVQLKLNCLRGVKNKIPSGRYILMVSLYNRLGGHVLRWSNLKGQQWAGATLPVSHEGHFYNAEVKIDQSVFTVLPSKANVRPSMCLVYELFLLRGAVVPTDRVVGWGAFPICDGQFDIVEGKYKLPLLRGEMDSRIDKYEKIEELMASDLDHWLCNVYIEIIKLPRYMAGQKEFEVELQFSSGMLSFPDRIHGQEVNKDGEQPVPGSLVQVDGSTISPASGELQASVHLSSVQDVDDDDSVGKKGGHEIVITDNKMPVIETVAHPGFLSVGGPGQSIGQDFARQIFAPPNCQMESEKCGSSLSLQSRDLKRPMTTHGSRGIHKEAKVHLPDDSDSTDYEDDDIFMLKKGDDEFIPVKGEAGLFYKRHLNNPADVYAKKMFTMLPKTPLLNKRKPRRKLTHLEQLEQHTTSVQSPFSEKGHADRNTSKRASYVSRQLLSELGLSQWRSREFWGMLMIFIIIFFVRIYIHYIGQWIYLNALTIPINKFDFLPYTVNLNYQNSLLHTREEIGIVVIGPGINIVIFVILVLFSWLAQKVFNTFPDIGSKFVIGYGLQTFLDPLLITIVDACLLRHENRGGTEPIADFAKLYWHFMRAEGSGLAGIFITVFLYVFIWFVSGSILYMYFLRLHNNGRMLDIYWRLHGSEENIFIPFDLEISNQELSYICKKAEQWRGEEGERRKVAVYDYIWEEEAMESTDWLDDQAESAMGAKKEVTTHLSIHTLHLDGLRELYRHFLRLPNGAIIEVFGEMGGAGLDKDMKSALMAGTQKVENLGSQYSLNKVRGRRTVVTASGLTAAATATTRDMSFVTPLDRSSAPSVGRRSSASGQSVSSSESNTKKTN